MAKVPMRFISIPGTRGATTAITIYANGEILIGSLRLRVAQEAERTKVSRGDGAEVLLPCARYALSTDEPDSGIPGRAQFEHDLLRSLERESAVDW